LNTDLVPNGDSKSAIFTGHMIGTATIRATSGALSTMDSGIITVTAPNIVIIKTADQSIINVGDIAKYTITVNNTGSGAADYVTVNDPLPVGVTWTTTTPGAMMSGGVLTDNIGTMAAGATVVINVSGVTSSANAGVLTNTATVNSTNNEPESLTATAKITVQPPNIVDSKTVKIAKDADGDGLAGPGDTLTYTDTIKNVGDGSATGVIFSDNPDLNTKLVVGSVTTTQGFISKGNITGNAVEVNIGKIDSHKDVTITFDVTINDPLWVFQIANQAIVKGANFSVIKSDDPGTNTIPDDPTITRIKTSPPVHGHGLSQWSIMGLTGLLGGAMVWVMRRRRILRQTH
jgi:uncharacterized repeat protein (TIGR01451 family)